MLDGVSVLAFIISFCNFALNYHTTFESHQMKISIYNQLIIITNVWIYL